MSYRSTLDTLAFELLNSNRESVQDSIAHEHAPGVPQAEHVYQLFLCGCKSWGRLTARNMPSAFVIPLACGLYAFMDV
jgi:hypothetical protein